MITSPHECRGVVTFALLSISTLDTITHIASTSTGFMIRYALVKPVYEAADVPDHLANAHIARPIAPHVNAPNNTPIKHSLAGPNSSSIFT